MAAQRKNGKTKCVFPTTIDMRVFTSYFGNVAYLRNNGILPVGICRFEPVNFDGPLIKDAAPTAETLMKYKEKHNKDEYIREYMSQLYRLDIASFVNTLETVSAKNGNKDIALCCYELPDEFCHRHLLAEFMNKFKILSDVHEFTAKDIIGKCYSTPLF